MRSDYSSIPTFKHSRSLACCQPLKCFILFTDTTIIVTSGIKGLDFHPHALRVQLRAGQEIVMCQFNVTYISLVQLKRKTSEHGAKCQIEFRMSQTLGWSVSVYKRKGLDVLDPKT